MAKQTTTTTTTTTAKQQPKAAQQQPKAAQQQPVVVIPKAIMDTLGTLQNKGVPCALDTKRANYFAAKWQKRALLVATSGASGDAKDIKAYVQANALSCTPSAWWHNQYAYTAVRLLGKGVTQCQAKTSTSNNTLKGFNSKVADTTVDNGQALVAAIAATMDANTGANHKANMHLALQGAVAGIADNKALQGDALITWLLALASTLAFLDGYIGDTLLRSTWQTTSDI